MPKNSLQSASGLGCGQVCPTCEPQPNGSGAQEDPPFILPHALWLCVQVTAKWYQGPRAMPQPPLLGLSWLSIDYPWKKQYVSSRVQRCISKGSSSLLQLFLERKLGITTQVLGQDSGAPHPASCKTSHIKTVLS